jgi:glycerol-3-phosphate acyltransferase PlsY
MASAALFTAVSSYLLGSIPFGYLLVRGFQGKDIRQSGSGNIGATNVARSSPLLGVLTLLLDALKGLAAVGLTAVLFHGQPNLLGLAAFCAILGHVFPLWLKFRGGKGVATGLGSFVLLAPKIVLAAVGIFLLIVALFRYVSLGSVIAVASFPLLVFFFTGYRSPTFLFLLASSLLIIAKHHQNLSRLRAGTEPRFQWRRS